MSEIKSSLLKAISDHLDSMERGISAARRNDSDLYTRTGPGDTYSRTSALTALKARGDE
jgi:hypothetical protein